MAAGSWQVKSEVSPQERESVRVALMSLLDHLDELDNMGENDFDPDDDPEGQMDQIDEEIGHIRTAVAVLMEQYGLRQGDGLMEQGVVYKD